MNKWVVLILMTLAFVAGGLSFYKMGQLAPSTASQAGGTASPLPAVASASPTVVASASPLAADSTPEALASRTIKGPNFGRPPGTRPNTPPDGKATPGGVTSPGAGKAPLVTGEIRAHIFSTEPGGPARTRFPKGTGNIYLTLSPVGISDKVELVASLRSAMDEKAPFSEPVQSSGPPRLRTFRFAPPAGGWVSGPYQVLVKPAGSEQVLTLSRFEVEPASQPTPQAMPTPQYLNLLTELSNPDQSSSVFTQNDPSIHLVVDSLNLPPGVTVRSVWSVVEVESLTPGELFAATETSPGRDQDALFSFAPPKGRFLPGSYRVDVYFDQQKVGSQAFFIQPAEKITASASPSPDATP